MLGVPSTAADCGLLGGTMPENMVLYTLQSCPKAAISCMVLAMLLLICMAFTLSGTGSPGFMPREVTKWSNIAVLIIICISKILENTYFSKLNVSI